MSLVSDLAHETKVAGYKQQVKVHTENGWQHKVRGAAAWEKEQKTKADTAEVRADTAAIKHEIALEQKAIAQTDLSYTRSMGALKSQGQQLKLQIKGLKVNGNASGGDSFRSSAANSVKSRPRVPVEV